MFAPTTGEEFLDLVRKSGLVAAEDLTAFVRQNEPLPGEPRKLAELLVGGGQLTDFQSTQLLQGKWRGFYLGRYRVLEYLGRGGMGAVYLCEHQALRRRVAVKVLPKVPEGDSSTLNRFYREARATAVLNHPNLVRAHDMDQEGDLHFLVMEYVDGSSLQDLVKRFGPLDATRAAHYVHQALLGLQHLHQAGLVHRDIKPGNILVDRQGTVKILDLGLARFFHDHQDMLTREMGDSSAIIGTADYIAPEQGVDSHDVDIRADLYGLGATFYFLLTGRPPFGDQPVSRKLLCHQLEEPAPIRVLRPEVPAGLAAVVQRMMAKDPARRYPTPAAAAEALAPWAQTPIPPPREEEMPRLSRAARGPALAGSGLRPLPPAPASDPTRPAPGPLSSPDTPSHALQAQTVELAEGVGPDNPTAKVQVQVPPNTEHGFALADTQIRMAVPPAAHRGPTSFANGRLRPRLVAAAVVAVLLLAGAIADCGLRIANSKTRDVSFNPRSAVRGPQSVLPPEPVGEAPPPRVRLVRAGAGQEKGFPTVREALLQARAGDRVVVQDEVLEEQLSLKGDGELGQGVTLEGGGPPGKPTTWRAPAGLPPGRPLVQLTDVAGLRLKGFRLDGREKVDDLVVLAGWCPGLALEDLHVQGYRGCGIKMDACRGDDGRPVSLTRVRATAGAEAAPALLFRTDPEQVNLHTTVRDCRFEGPCHTAIRVAGSVSALRVEGNRFYKVGTGLLYQKANPGQRFYVTLASNTFCGLQSAVRFAALPPAEHTHLEVTSNLFVRTRKLAQVDDFPTQPDNVPARWIWLDERGRPAAPRQFRTTFQLPAGYVVSRATLDIACVRAFTVWVNGERVGEGELTPAGRRVYAFDVARLLRPGKNVVAVQGRGRVRWNGWPAPSALLAQLTYSSTGGAPTHVFSDPWWRASLEAPAGWQQVDFDDSKWSRAKVKAFYGIGPAAVQSLNWDSVVREWLPGYPPLQLLTAKSNYHDRDSREGFPVLDATPVPITLPTDPTNDAEFLRYAKSSFLSEAGPKKTPVGVPPLR